MLVELRGQAALAGVLRNSDVRTILGGHLHYSTTATFAGIPVSVASATCYTQDLNVPVGGTRGRDGGQSFNLVHVYEHTIVHSVVLLAGHSRGGRACLGPRSRSAGFRRRRHPDPEAGEARGPGKGPRPPQDDDPQLMRAPGGPPPRGRPARRHFSQGALIGKYFSRKSVTSSARSSAGTSGKLPSFRQKKSMFRFASSLGR